MSAQKIILLCVGSTILGGCGLFTPEMQTIWQRRDQQKEFENIIVNNVKCEIRNGVYEARQMLQTTSQHPGNDIGWLDQQGATVTLKLSVDEKSSLNPGISYGEPIFSAGIGTANSADATRTEIVAFTYSFYDLLREKGVEKYLGKPCEDENGVFIQSNLKIRDFIINKVFLAKVPGTVVIDDIPGAKPKPLASPFSTFSYQITFVASFGVNGTPSWKFTRITVNPGSPFFSTSQQRTQDVTITIGKTTRASKDSPAKPSLETVNLHEAALIGQAVATAIQSQAR